VSVVDELTQLEEHVQRRMRELKPLVDEYSELEVVAKRLGISPAAQDSAPRRRSKRGGTTASRSASKATSKSSRTRRATARATRPTRARAGKRRDDVLAAVKRRPGVTIREVGEELGVDPTSLYRVVHGLQSDGLVRKDGRGLQLAGSVPAIADNGASPAAGEPAS